MPSSDVPEYLDYEKVKESGAVERIYEDEDEYSLVYKNADGTRTLYLYDVPIKRENAKGEFIDKTLKFSANAKGGYSAEESGIAVNFPEKLSDGISYGEKERSFTIIPNAEPGCAAILSEDGKSISYAVSESVIIVYSLSFTGIKEDIVIDEYTGENTFTYTLKTDGLYPKTNKGELYLYSSDGECVYSLGDVWVYDSKGINNIFGDIEYTVNETENEYSVTVSVSEEYLSNPGRVFPITVDPTITVTGAANIEDVTMCSIAGTDPITSGSLYAGLGNTDGKMRFAMRFSALSSNAAYNSLTANQILSASISLRDLICNSNSVSISCNSFSTGYLPAVTWTQSNMTWSLVSTDSRFTRCSSKSVFYGNGTDGTNWYDFDATAIVKAWKNGTKANKVAVFKTTSAVETGTVGTYLTFASSDRASNNPSLTITYLPDIMTESTKTVGIGYSGIISYNPAPAGYHITATSSSPSVATVSNGLTITAISAGTTTITAKYVDNNNFLLFTIDYCNIIISDNGIEHYMIQYTDGEFLSNTLSALTHNEYSNNLSSSVWNFVSIDGTNCFYIYTDIEPTKCLTVLPNNNVTISTFTGAASQKWSMSFVDSVPVLASHKTQNEKKYLYYLNNTYVVDENNYTRLSFVEKNVFTPCSNISMNTVASLVNGYAPLSYSFTPQTVFPANYFDIFVTGTSNYINNNYVYTNTTGVFTISISNRITNVSHSSTLYVINGINLTADRNTVYIGETLQLNGSTTPYNLPLQWSSSNNSIATVNSSGVITGISKGNVTITARCIYNNSIYTSITLSIDNRHCYNHNESYLAALYLDGDSWVLVPSIIGFNYSFTCDVEYKRAGDVTQFLSIDKYVVFWNNTRPDLNVSAYIQDIELTYESETYTDLVIYNNNEIEHLFIPESSQTMLPTVDCTNQQACGKNHTLSGSIFKIDHQVTPLTFIYMEIGTQVIHLRTSITLFCSAALYGFSEYTYETNLFNYENIMKNKNIIIICCLTLVIVLLAGTVVAGSQTNWFNLGNSQQNGDKTVVATVNGLPIYKNGVDGLLAAAQLTGQTTDYNAVLNSLIESKLLISAAQKRGVEVSEDIIEETAKRTKDFYYQIKESNPEDESYIALRDYISGLGMTEEEYFTCDLVMESYRNTLNKDAVITILLKEYAEKTGSDIPAIGETEYKAFYESMIDNLKNDAQIIIY